MPISILDPRRSPFDRLNIHEGGSDDVLQLGDSEDTDAMDARAKCPLDLQEQPPQSGNKRVRKIAKTEKPPTKRTKKTATPPTATSDANLPGTGSQHSGPKADHQPSEAFDDAKSLDIVDCIRKAEVRRHHGQLRVMFYVKWQGEEWADEERWNTWQAFSTFHSNKNEAVRSFLRSDAWDQLVKSAEFESLPMKQRESILKKVQKFLD